MPEAPIFTLLPLFQYAKCPQHESLSFPVIYFAIHPHNALAFSQLLQLYRCANMKTGASHAVHARHSQDGSGSVSQTLLDRHKSLHNW